MVDRYVLHQRGWNGDRCRCNCNSFRALVARGGISANCPQEPSIGIRPVVAQARRKLALSTGTNWGGPSYYRAASRIALTCWTDGFAEAVAAILEEGVAGAGRVEDGLQLQRLAPRRQRRRSRPTRAPPILRRICERGQCRRRRSARTVRCGDTSPFVTQGGGAARPLPPSERTQPATHRIRLPWYTGRAMALFPPPI